MTKRGLVSVYGPVIIAAVTLKLIVSPALSMADKSDPRSLTELSIEDLMDVKVVTASKKEESAFGSTSAIRVLTHDDIIRSGATNIPEALRLVPGLYVARKDSNNYVITSRGYSDLPFTDKLLVMIDGRSIHSPTFSQVWWPAVNYPLDDVERIEVILGPGSALWGANASNGIINIITKSASKTAGPMVSAGGGSQEKWFGTARYGWEMGGNSSASAYFTGSGSDRGRVINDVWSDNPADGGELYNKSRNMQAGFRADWSGADSRISLHGDIYDNTSGSEGDVYKSLSEGVVRYENDDKYNGKNILLRAERTLSENLAASFQTYYDSTHINKIFFEEALDTGDVEAQLAYRGITNHTLTAGLNYRVSASGFTSTDAVIMPDVTNNLYGFFAKNEYTAMGGKLKLSLEAKAEKNDFTDWAFQPAFKAAWVENDWMTWFSVEKSARLSNPVNKDFLWNWQYDAGSEVTPTVYRITGSEWGNTEEFYSIEAGIRFKPLEKVFVDISSYYNQSPNVMDFTDTGDPVYADSPQPHYVQDLEFINLYEGISYGAEAVVRADVAGWARIYLGYAYNRMAIKPKPGQEGHQTEADWVNTGTPPEIFRAGLFLDLPYRFKFDTVVYITGAAPGITAQYYNRLDLRLSYRPAENFEVAVVGRNLGAPLHFEHEPVMQEDSSWISQDFYVKLTYGM
ncbi:MAG: TonB-dependent receptor plug domain-containing protein [Nitrospinae bacterium]|nr:TonB-dependent receptor plug domain-containing protein [Nitrospinota bacterium]